MEDSFIIEGGKPLKGQIKLSGAKNVALKVIIAALLFNEEVVLEGIPRISDVNELLDLINKLGGSAHFTGPNTVTVDPRNISNNKVDLLHSSKIRVSFMLFAPLLHRFPSCFIPNPGGCRIGARPIDRIVDGLKALGAVITYNSDTGYYKGSLSGKPKGSYAFPKVSHTGTELLIMLAAIGNGGVSLHNCALEPEIDELISFLNTSGAKIQRKGNDIIISSVPSLSYTSPFKVGSDRNEAVTFASLALATKGDVTIYPILKTQLLMFIKKVEEAGGGFSEEAPGRLRFYYLQPLKHTHVETAPHPGFMTDWQPNWAVLMTQATGESLICERVFENRFSYVSELHKLGGVVEYVKDPHMNPADFFFNFDPSKKYNQTIKVTGPQHLHGGALQIADLRAGATLAIAALIAEGESVINNASILERGYENFAEKVQSLGGTIKKI